MFLLYLATQFMDLTSPLPYAVQSFFSGKEGAGHPDAVITWRQETQWVYGVFRDVVQTGGLYDRISTRECDKAIAGLHLLSFGKVEPDTIVYYPTPEWFDSGEKEAEWIERARKQCRLCCDIARIWKCSISPAVLSLRMEHDEPAYTEGEEETWKMGRALGIDLMVDAYLSGIPVEDILAGA